MTVAAQAREETPAPVAPPEEVVTVRRFCLPDLQTHGLWLYEKLQPKFPHISQQYLTAWIRGAIETNQYYFVCTDKAAGIAQANHRPLVPQPYVDVIFVHSIDDSDRGHEPAIYQAMERWGKGLGAFEMNYGDDLKADQITAIKSSGSNLHKIYTYFSPID